MKETKPNHTLEFSDVYLTYHSKEGETLAVKDLNFYVREGEFMAVIGPSGCGKTTVLSLAAGLLKPSSGEITVCGKPAAEYSGSLGYMLQKDELFPWRTVEKNILLPLEIKKRTSPQSRDRALALAAKYGLKDFLKHYPEN